jgi:hypothetical protein
MIDKSLIAPQAAGLGENSPREREYQSPCSSGGGEPFELPQMAGIALIGGGITAR